MQHSVAHAPIIQKVFRHPCARPQAELCIQTTTNTQRNAYKYTLSDYNNNQCVIYTSRTLQISPSNLFKLHTESFQYTYRNAAIILIH